jgi:eukaryotic-like serine/threonine-protein kinase
MTELLELTAGRMLGRYELLVPLAQGATAQVWAARTTGSRLQKIVAVKVLLADVSEDVDVETMFLDEARLVSRIRHPNVASVLDLGDEEDTLYIVIEWIEGEPLQIVLREANARGGVPLPLALRIVKQAASGLHAAHELCDEAGKPIGLVHRDVSPQNILVGYDGAVKVIDFGVAKATTNMQRTSVGQIKGKVPYMAPEQAVGEPIDRRTDVFALGVVLYQLVTAKHPFRGDSDFATLSRLRDRNPADSPRKHIPDLPPALEEVMLKALSKQRDGRFATMLELARALERAVPSPLDVDRSLGTFISGLLSQRSAKRAQSIREALRSLGGDSDLPANFGGKAAVEELPPWKPAVPPPVAASVAPASVAPAPLPVSAPPPPLPAPASASGDRSSTQLPEGLRPKSSRIVLIVGLIALVVALTVALFSMLGKSAGTDGGTDSPPRRSF